MHSFYLRIILISSILWGVGYPNLFRIPLYVYVITISLILSNSFKLNSIRNIQNLIDVNKISKFNINYFWFLLLFIYFFIWKTFSIFYLLTIISFVLIGSFLLKMKK